MRQVLAKQRREIAVTVAAKFVETAPYYTFTIFIIGYATQQIGHSRGSVLNVLTLVSLATAIPLMGWISDRIGRKTLFVMGCVGIAWVTPVYFMLVDQGRLWTLALALVLTLGLVWPMVTSVLGTMFSEMFRAEVRYSGIS
ncbi:MAG: MFS transporter [Steroidobacteraceae bacterium]